MKIKKWAVTATALVAAVGGLSACGGDAETTDSSSSKLKGDPIVIGTFGSFTGPNEAVLGKASVGVEAWVKDINDNGGLNGHPVKLMIRDDASDPAKALQAAKELVEQDKVVAIVGQMSNASSGAQAYLEKKKVPVVGGLAAEQTFLVSADFFPSGNSAVMETYGMMKEAKKAGATKVGALYCAESPTCAQVDGLGKAFSQMLDLGWASNKVSATQPNYTAQCLSMKDSDVDALFAAHNGAVSARIIPGCTKAGYDPKFQVGLMNPVVPALLDLDQYEGASLVGSNASATDESVPGIKEFRTAVEAFEKGATDDPQFNISVQSWAGAKLFQAAAEQAKLSPTSTSADVYAGLYALKGEDLGGIVQPLTFTEGKPTFLSCYFHNTVKDKAVVAVDSAPQCLDDTELAAVGQLLAQMG